MTTRLPWRDTLATMFVAIAFLVYGVWALGPGLPGFERVGAVALAVLGLGVAASASAVVPGFAELLRGSRVYLVVASAVGLVALGAGVWALVADETTALAILVLSTLVLWGMSTARHITMHRNHERVGLA